MVDQKDNNTTQQPCTLPALHYGVWKANLKGKAFIWHSDKKINVSEYYQYQMNKAKSKEFRPIIYM